MKNISPALKTLLTTSSYLLAADLYTYTLADGTVLRYADCTQDIIVGANTFLCPKLGTIPGHKRGKIRTAIGLQAETLEINMLHDANTVLLGTRPGAFAKAGGFDGALIKVDKLLTDDFNNTTRGVVNLFSGGIFDADAAGNRVTMNATTDLVFLNNQFPRRYLLPSCNNALFDSRCKLLKASFKVSGTATGGTVGTITSALGQAAGYFELGYVEIKTGVNAGLRRQVKFFSSGTFTLLYPLPAACASGDTFDAYPGCDKLESTCIDKFNNKPNFGGFPYVPTPEVIELGSTAQAPGTGPTGGGGYGAFGTGTGGQLTRFKLK